MIGSNKDSWMVVRTTDSKKKHAISKTYLNPFGPWQALPTLEPPDHRCLFAMFVLWESVGYGCLLYLHFVLGGECFWRADSHEKGSLLHRRQVSGFFKVARYWLPDHWQDWVGSSIFSKQKNISIEKIDLAWSWPTATQSEKSTITLNSGSAINYLQPSGFERCRRCHWSNAHGFPRVDSINRRSSLDFFSNGSNLTTLSRHVSHAETMCFSKKLAFNWYLRMGAPKVLHSQLGIQGWDGRDSILIFQPDATTEFLESLHDDEGNSDVFWCQNSQ